MADINISTPVDTVAAAETGTHIAVCHTVAPYDGVTVAESVTTPVMALKLYRGTQSITVSLITMDWALITAYKKFTQNGVPLKGLVLIPGSGGPDTFCVKDGADDGAYLYKGAVSVATTIIYPGNLCKPYIDFSECTLSTGHLITFIW